MNVRKSILTALLLSVLLLPLGAQSSLAQEPQAEGDLSAQALVGSAFTYQGQLKLGDFPVENTCDFQFSLFDAVTSGAQIGTSQSRNSVPIVGGYFTVQLDFGAGAFQGDARWLAVGVRCPAGNGDYSPLTPRQPLTPAPYALYSLDADLLDGDNSDHYRTHIAVSQINASQAITSTCASYAGGSITIVAATSGTIVVEASVLMSLTHMNGTKDVLWLNIDSATAVCETPITTLQWTIPASYPSTTSDEYTFTVRRAFAVAAGTHTYYLNGQMPRGATGVGDEAFRSAEILATFYPD